jgi:hypothetical protein
MRGGMGGTLLGSSAAAFAGSLVAQSLFSEFGGEEAAAEGDGGAEGAAGDAGVMPEAGTSAAGTSAAGTSASKTGRPSARGARALRADTDPG